MHVSVPLGINRGYGHNVVIGPHHGWTNIGGSWPGTSIRSGGPFSSILGGSGNAANGMFSVVSGGSSSTVSGTAAVVSGGEGLTTNTLSQHLP